MPPGLRPAPPHSSKLPLGLSSATGYLSTIAGVGRAGQAADCSTPVLLSIQGFQDFQGSTESSPPKVLRVERASAVPRNVPADRHAGSQQKAVRSKNISLERFYHFEGTKFQLIALVRTCMVLALLA